MKTDTVYKLLLICGALSFCLMVGVSVRETPLFSGAGQTKPAVEMDLSKEQDDETDKAESSSQAPESRESEADPESDAPESRQTRPKAKPDNPESSGGAAKETPDASSAPASAPIWEDINKVTREQLLEIAGITEETADRFLAFREQIGYIPDVLYLEFIEEISREDKKLLSEHLYVSEAGGEE